MEIRKWWKDLKKEKERKKLVQAAKELEAKADPSLPKKRLPKNEVVKQDRKDFYYLNTFLYMNKVFFQDGFKSVVLYLKWIKSLNFFKK